MALADRSTVTNVGFLLQHPREIDLKYIVRDLGQWALALGSHDPVNQGAIMKICKVQILLRQILFLLERPYLFNYSLLRYSRLHLKDE